MQGSDFDIKENAQIMAQLQYKISKFEGKDFPSGHDVMKERILQSSFLDEEEKNHVLKILDSLPQVQAFVIQIYILQTSSLQKVGNTE